MDFLLQKLLHTISNKGTEILKEYPNIKEVYMPKEGLLPKVKSSKTLYWPTHWKKL